MPRLGVVQKNILNVLEDGKSRSSREIVEKTGLASSSISDALRRLWQDGYVLRSDKPIYKVNRAFKGRAGISSNLRTYYLYMLRPFGEKSIWANGNRFVSYAKKYLDVRGRKLQSKAKIVVEFLKKNKDNAWYSTEIADALKENGIKPSDVMTNVRRYEKKGLVYIRGYRTDYGESPFREGYLITWIEEERPREQALEEAIQRTEDALKAKASTNQFMHRVHIVKDAIFECSKLRDLASFEYIKSKLDCSEHQAEGAITRALQLYPELREIKLFNAYRYYFHNSMPQDELRAAIAMKENYIRKVKGKANRIGHNWEAAVGFFIDTLTTGATFWSQKHRNEGMNERRITIHLVKSVSGRKYNAEVDRVWEVTPGPLLQSTTYVLECKWGLVRKKDVDDFFNVLRWSKEFGVDTPEGRQIKQGVIGVFAGSAFDPKETVKLADESKISLATYAARMNIQLLKASDFNEKLIMRGCPRKTSVQKICKIAKDENEVREVLELVWKNPEKTEKILEEVAERNKDIYELEKMLEKTNGQFNGKDS